MPLSSRGTTALLRTINALKSVLLDVFKQIGFNKRAKVSRIRAKRGDKQPLLG